MITWGKQALLITTCVCACVSVSAIEKVAKTVDKMPELPFSEKQVLSPYLGSSCGFEKKINKHLMLCFSSNLQSPRAHARARARAHTWSLPPSHTHTHTHSLTHTPSAPIHPDTHNRRMTVDDSRLVVVQLLSCFFFVSIRKNKRHHGRGMTVDDSRLVVVQLLRGLPYE